MVCRSLVAGIAGFNPARAWIFVVLVVCRECNDNYLKNNIHYYYYYYYYTNYNNNDHQISFMELNHMLTRSGLTYPEDTSKVYHDSLCPLGSSVSLPRVIYFEAFCFHVVSSFSCIPVICPKLVIFLPPLYICVFVFLI